MDELSAYLPSTSLSKHGWAIYTDGVSIITLNSGQAHIHGKVSESLQRELDKLTNIQSVTRDPDSYTIVILTANEILVEVITRKESNPYTKTVNLVPLQFQASDVKQAAFLLDRLVLLTRQGQMYISNETTEDINRFVAGKFQLLSLPHSVVQIVTDDSNGVLLLSGNGSVYLVHLEYDLSTSLELPEPVSQLSGGGSTALFVSITGNVYAYGINYSGRLGLGYQDRNSFFPPTLVPLSAEIGEVTAVSLGHDSSVLLTSKGEVYAVGANYLGQLGAGLEQIISWEFVRVKLEEKVIAIASYLQLHLFLTSSGKVYGCGYGYQQQLQEAPLNGNGQAYYRTPVLITTLA